MISATSNSEPEVQTRPKKGFFFEYSYERYLTDYHSQEYNTEFKNSIASLIFQGEKNGTAHNDVTESIDSYIHQELEKLRNCWIEEGEMQPNEIQAVSNDMFIQMNQIAREIMEDRWLQNLKKECKTIIAEEQEKATAPEVIKEQVDALILQKIKALQQVEESAELQQEEIVQMDQDLLAKAEKIIRPLLLEKEAAQQEISEEVAEFLEEVKKECANFIAYYKQEKGPKLEIFDLIYNAINDRLAQLDETMRYREVPPEEITETVLQASRELQEFAYPVLSEFDKDTRVELELDVNDLHHRLLHNLKKECETIIADGQENGKTSGDIADQIQQKVSKIAVSHRETMKNHGVPPEEIEGKASLFLQELKRTVTPFLQKPQESRKRDFSAMMTSPTTTHDDPNIGASSSASPHLPQRKGLRP